MKFSKPILLSFYGLSNGTRNVFFGKLAYSAVGDLSFKEYSWLKNFKTIVGLYRTRAVANAPFEMIFDNGSITGTTDVSGSFWCEVDLNKKQTKLLEIKLTSSGENVLLTEELYPNKIHAVESHTIVISDLDDTLIHSFIRNKLVQIRTLLFTTVEKRQAVKDMSHLIKRFALAGADAFYLSNSEQNLYPMLFRFLTINKFPPGPLFLKQYIHIRDMVTRRLMGKKHSHKMNTLGKLMELFPNKKYILIGDNTQKDLSIYLKLADMFPERIRYIIIRKVRHREEDVTILSEARDRLQRFNIPLHYESTYPEDLPWEI
jgi:phosphatidate phosphatase APP1